LTHSTNGEDDALFAYFKGQGINNGRFLDIGASNGITLSNTHLFALAGWKGICIDANAQELFNLNTLYWDNPNIEIVEGCISDSHGLKEFWNAKSANISTSSKRMQDRGRERTGARKCLVAGFTLHDIWERFGDQYDFINIDLEDGSLPIMRGLPDNVLDHSKAICVEHLDPRWYFGENEEAEIKAWGETKGFKFFMRTDENVLLVKA
jgi:FkbM family methyltransferase